MASGTGDNLVQFLLKKQIDLLEKSQEYRCCPAAASDDD